MFCHTSFVLLLLSFCQADYTIRTRQKGDKEVLSPSSHLVVSTIGIPPYISTHFDDSKGLVPDLLEIIGPDGGIPKNATLHVSKEATAGAVGGTGWSGIAEDAKFKFTHFSVGPILDNLYLAEDQIHFGANWHSPRLAFIVGSGSPLAREPIDDISNVDFYAVDKSAELQLLTDHRLSTHEKLREELRKRPPFLVSDICQGLKKFGAIDADGTKLKTAKSHIASARFALITNSLEAGHYASGNKLVTIVSPVWSSHVPLGDFTFMSHVDFRQLNGKVNTAVGKKKKDIEAVVKRWQGYDENACKKLREALKDSAAPAAFGSSFLISAAAFVLFHAHLG